MATYSNVPAVSAEVDINTVAAGTPVVAYTVPANSYAIMTLTAAGGTVDLREAGNASRVTLAIGSYFNLTLGPGQIVVANAGCTVTGVGVVLTNQA